VLTVRELLGDQELAVYFEEVRAAAEGVEARAVANWLFAGSHDGAQNIAMYRSLFATCYLNGINPYRWFKYVLTNIYSTEPANYQDLLPHRIDKTLLSKFTRCTC